jgi:hypothetical protein
MSQKVQSFEDGVSQEQVSSASYLIPVVHKINIDMVIVMQPPTTNHQL